jgi:hypothetical protein
MMNRESKKNRGLLRTNSQIQVANQAGDVIGTNATRTVGNAAKDACNLIMADWQTHGGLNAPEAPAAPAEPAATVQPAVQTSPAVQPVPAVATRPQVQPAVVTVAAPATGSISLGDAAKKEKRTRRA